MQWMRCYRSIWIPSQILRDRWRDPITAGQQWLTKFECWNHRKNRLNRQFQICKPEMSNPRKTLLDNTAKQQFWIDQENLCLGEVLNWEIIDCGADTLTRTPRFHLQQLKNITSWGILQGLRPQITFDLHLVILWFSWALTKCFIQILLSRFLIEKFKSVTVITLIGYLVILITHKGEQNMHLLHMWLIHLCDSILWVGNKGANSYSKCFFELW